MSYPTGTNLISSTLAPAPKPRLLDEVRRRLRVKHYSVRTGKAYVGWIRRFILANGKRHPREMGAPEVEAFLTGLAVEGDVAASTQNQALSALLFLYREVLAIDLPWLEQVTRAKSPDACRRCFRRTRPGRCSPTWRGARGWWRACSTAPACA